MKDYLGVSTLFYYDETSPSCLRWKSDVYAGIWKNILKVAANDPAGGIDHQGYWGVKTGGATYKIHRIIWTILKGDILPYPDENIDHINGVRHDNKIVNLRVVTRRQNSQNQKKRADNKSGVVGVSLQDFGTRAYYVASWKDSDCSHRSKYFSVNTYGKETAFEMACTFRKERIEELLLLGQDYTTSHGVR